MRTRQQFRDMARTCEQIFEHAAVKNLRLRYFDPTLSAASGHEDKGLIECLMVKCARVLIYMAGERDSYGKDAEAAIAARIRGTSFFRRPLDRGDRRGDAYFTIYGETALDYGADLDLS
jgi:hypothetical protein